MGCLGYVNGFEGLEGGMWVGKEGGEGIGVERNWGSINVKIGEGVEIICLILMKKGGLRRVGFWG